MYYKVIIVEDEDIIRNGIKYSIDWQKYNAQVVADVDNAVDAQKLIEKFRPDILIVDINMPILSGLELIRKMIPKYNFSSIIISGYDNFEYAQEAIQLDVIRYISKPINTEELIEALQSAIKKQQIKEKINLHQDIEKSIRIDKHYNKLNHNVDANKIIDFIHMNFNNQIKMQDVEDAVGLSDSTINLRLKESVGRTFIQYLNNYRINKAIIEIELDTNINLQALSSDVGIPNYKHFSYVFKKETGYSPREFILNIMNNKNKTIKR